MMVRYSVRNAGFSLMEVLISALVLAIGLLGLAGLQVAGVKSGHSVYYRTQATMLANDIMDRMRSNARTAREGSYDVPSIKAYSETGSAREVVDLNIWKSRLDEIFPSFDGSINCSADGVCLVAVQWDDSRPEILLQAGDEQTPPSDTLVVGDDQGDTDAVPQSRRDASGVRRFTMRTRL